ncbi:hypothetical protein B0T09DRAFT_332847 [Sordaria sp. MPI-SDFR-AT-0083]|nr:hypothetical protein B0T09DRAFT_332847 [Sordaria sp. MPI-SDFR-AT-0083]
MRKGQSHICTWPLVVLGTVLGQHRISSPSIFSCFAVAGNAPNASILHQHDKLGKGRAMLDDRQREIVLHLFTLHYHMSTSSAIHDNCQQQLPLLLARSHFDSAPKLALVKDNDSHKETLWTTDTKHLPTTNAMYKRLSARCHMLQRFCKASGIPVQMKRQGTCRV